ncbi:MAG: hypothetical protein IT371_14325 [Deltaproteobacteria bacterium]|nr:hypothetical protein [Deltaproteobacteria bacterium]
MLASRAAWDAEVAALRAVGASADALAALDPLAVEERRREADRAVLRAVGCDIPADAIELWALAARVRGA